MIVEYDSAVKRRRHGVAEFLSFTRAVAMKSSNAPTVPCELFI